MGLDIKQKVLIAIYTEYQKDLPNIDDNVKANILNVDNQVFNVAIEKLENEGLIRGSNLMKGGSSTVWNTIMVNLVHTKMTPYGIAYVEEKLGIEKTLSGAEKVKYISLKAAEWGWDQFKDIASKTLSEIVKNQFEK